MVSRVAVIEYDLCHPDKCGTPCIRFCPVNLTRPYKAIELSSERKGKPVIHEELCIACGICVKKCPYNAIHVVNLPEEVEEKLVHRYGPNAFKLYGIPIPIKGKIIGVIGRNGIGKTTSLRILSGELLPNFGKYDQKISVDQVLEMFRGTELYGYFKDLYNKKLRVIHKIQYIEYIPRYIKQGTVKDILRRVDERGLVREVTEILNMERMLDRDVKVLSGGELQKLAIAAAILRQADVYIFDEPTAYLDIRERLRLALALKELLPNNVYVLVVDHDLTTLDYIADYIVVAYGEPSVYGMFSKLYAVGTGINHYLEGYLPSENMRIRDEKIVFYLHEREEAKEITREGSVYVEWSSIKKRLGSFLLETSSGRAYKGEVIGIVGPNAIGKTTFIRILAGELEPDDGFTTTKYFTVSIKPQYIDRSMLKCETVENCISKVNKDALNPSHWLFHEVIRRLNIDRILKREVKVLSGGELQKLFIALCLVKDADIYLLDEPSAHIDVEDKLNVARAIKRTTRIRKAISFVVDHDLLILDYVSDHVIAFCGEPEVHGTALSPLSISTALNEFLRNLNVTFRRDPRTGRPRMNKPGSYLDRIQKARGEYMPSKPITGEELSKGS